MFSPALIAFFNTTELWLFGATITALSVNPFFPSVEIFVMVIKNGVGLFIVRLFPLALTISFSGANSRLPKPTGR